MPFMAKSDNLKVGLNNLGNRNAAERLFSTLLPGMNNVTQRIRYYSFYCWLLKNFYTGEKEARESQFRNYIRYAEYLLALIHAYNNDTHGVPGTTVAIAATLEDENEYSVKDGAEGNGIRKYWAYPNGILGSYYIVAMSDLKLVGFNNQSNVFYNITKGEHDYITGEQVANAFAASVGQSGALFLQCVKRGVVTNTELEKLYKTFNMHSLAAFPQERSILENMLVEDDYPYDEAEMKVCTSYRRDTIKYFLQYVQSYGSISDQGFARYMYGQYMYQNNGDDTSARWYAYYLDDQWQYNSTIIFSRLLTVLGGKKGWTSVDELADEMSTEIVGRLGWKATDSVASVLNSNKTDVVTERPDAAEAFCNLIKLASVNKGTIEEVHKRCGINDQSTFSTFCRYIEKHLAGSIEDFIHSFIVDQIIYRHYIVSFVKQQATGIASQKFILENDRMLFVAPYEASHTAPRIAMLANFLIDLSLIDNNSLTPDGNKLLDRL